MHPTNIEAQACVESLRRELEALKGTQEQLRQSQMAQQSAERQLNSILHSTIWRRTILLRRFGTLVKRTVNLGKRLLKELADRGIADLAQEMRARQASGTLKTSLARALKGTAPKLDTTRENPHYDAWIGWSQSIHDRDRDRILSETDGATKFSIVMPTYNSDVALLDSAILSVVKQSYPHWELCIADDASTDHRTLDALRKWRDSDARIKVTFRESNGHICASTNTAIEATQYPYVGFLDHDDALHPDALMYYAWTIHRLPSTELIYCDEDKIDVEGNRWEPFFKPNFQRELLLAQNYICHFAVYSRSLLERVGNLRPGYEGSQDWDLALRASARTEPSNIVHIPYVLYHWRFHSGSTAADGAAKPYAILAGERAVNDFLKTNNVDASASINELLPNTIRVAYALPPDVPEVEIIIPSRNNADTLQKCIDSVLSLTAYPKYRICLVNNGSNDIDAVRLFDAHRNKTGFRVIDDDSPFNYSKLNNSAARTSTAPVLCLMNDDIEAVSKDWLTEMVSLACQQTVGCVGPLLMYPDRTIQHAGVMLGLGGAASHAHRHLTDKDKGYFGWLSVRLEFAAVTAACLVVRRSVYEQCNGLDERLAVAYNDIDFCMRVRTLGYRNLFTPYATLIHHESKSRGPDNTPYKSRRFDRERSTFIYRWMEEIQRDPVLSVNLSRMSEQFAIVTPDELSAIPVWNPDVLRSDARHDRTSDWTQTGNNPSSST